MESLLTLTKNTDEERTERKIDILCAAREAFELSDWISGTLSGGIEAPRIILRAIAVKDKVFITYTHQNGMYTDKRAGKEFEETYLYKDGELSVVGKDTLFPITKEDSFFDLVEDEISDFCEEYGVKAKGL